MVIEALVEVSSMSGSFFGKTLGIGAKVARRLAGFGPRLSIGTLEIPVANADDRMGTFAAGGALVLLHAMLF